MQITGKHLNYKFKLIKLFRKMLEFVRLQAQHFKWGPDGSQVAVVQFTPQAKYEFGFVTDNFETLERRLNVGFLKFTKFITNFRQSRTCHARHQAVNVFMTWYKINLQISLIK
jgi:hypothetical protein